MEPWIAAAQAAAFAFGIGLGAFLAALGFVPFWRRMKAAERELAMYRGPAPEMAATAARRTDFQVISALQGALEQLIAAGKGESEAAIGLRTRIGRRFARMAKPKQG